MVIQAIMPRKQPRKQSPSSEPVVTSGRVSDMGALSEENVIIRRGKKPGDPGIITVSCPVELGLACDLARAIFEFGLDVVRADFSTDGQWCLMLFWVAPKRGPVNSIKWALLKKRLIGACPSPVSSLLMPYLSKAEKQKEIYLLQTCCTDRVGLINDLTQTLWELEVDVLKLNALTSPDGKAVEVFYLQESRNLMPSKKRHEVVCDHVNSVLGTSQSLCELGITSEKEVNESLDLALFPTIPIELFSLSTEEDALLHDLGLPSSAFSVNIDNSLSPGHTLLQITFSDRRGILYDCMRVLRDLNIQIAYGRLSITPKGIGDLDLFVLQANGNKLYDPEKQKSLVDRLRVDMCEPIRVLIVDKGPDTELLVATTVEKSGRSRPRLLHDVTLVLKMLEISIFKAENDKIAHGDRLWDVYRFLLIEKHNATTFRSTRIRSQIVERVRGILMG